MDMQQSFEQFLARDSAPYSTLHLGINMLLSIVFALLLAWTYIRAGGAASNRRTFARNFAMLCPTTALIIMVVKSSLALSLGLIGALSIVRFRAAIKEPEELSYLFLCIAVGLGFGAGQREITVIGFALVWLVIWMTYKMGRHRVCDESLWLTVSATGPRLPQLQDLVEALSAHCATLHLRRFDEMPNSLEARFLAEFSDFADVEAARASLRKLDNSIQVAVLDNRPVG